MGLYGKYRQPHIFILNKSFANTSKSSNMKFSTLFLTRMLPVGLAFGTAWAVRGQIGHEYGATWAAAIGILTAIALSGREDWYKRLPIIVVLGAIAWGAGGMISYGKIVGYSHAPDLLNTGYGMLMLTIVGGLYGFMGGGIVGLTLESTPARKVDWASLFTQMAAGGYLFWGTFIHQLEWFMTPPRSELWAACMGASLALGWYMYRNGYTRALRTAWYSSLGAGFGFGFGVFLQRAGHASGIKFNWWNVMEYSIGFFSGLGLAFSLFTRKWPKTVVPDKTSNLFGWVFLLVLLPVINLIEAVQFEKLVKQGASLNAADTEQFASSWILTAWILSVLFAIALSYYYKPGKLNGSKNKTIGFTLLYLTWYILISNIISATWLHSKFDSQHLYWVNLLVIAIILFKDKTVSVSFEEEADSDRRWKAHLVKCWGIALLIILLVASLAITFSYKHGGAQLRFE